jgi:hypothetical protein
MAGCDDENIIDLMQHTKFPGRYAVRVAWNITNKLTLTCSKQAS